ncbi:MAG: VacB/RNase II family 3'-5' exoribonuclease, partial [Bdellovibrionota bacterium]
STGGNGGRGTPRRGSSRKDQPEKRQSQGSRSRRGEGPRTEGAGRAEAGARTGPRPSPFGNSAGGNDKTKPPQIIEGRVDIHADGFGFLIPSNPAYPNVYIGKESLANVMHRDDVRVQITQSFDDGKMRGTVLEIVRRHQKEFLGLYRPHKGGALIVPMETRDRNHVFKLEPEAKIPEGLKNGACVLCQILEYPSKLPGLTRIEKVFEDPKAPSMDTLRCLLEASWPREASAVAAAEAEEGAKRWKERLSPSRKDIRHLPLVTIDGRDARDFDDAVCAKAEGPENIRLWVAIADVSLFVKPGTALDREAYEKATSVYFPDHVVPMLPEVLSNGVCSLNPNEDRPCLVCECVINKKGLVVDYQFYEGLMLSKRRLTYEQMQAFIEKDTWAIADLEPLSESLTTLVHVFERLHEAKDKRGAIDLDIPEAQIILNPDGSVRDIQPRTRITAHRLIEECMLIANDCTARFLHEHCKAGVYRIHEEPDPRKSKEFVDFLSLQGINVVELLGRKWERRQGGDKGGKEESSEGSPLAHAQDYSTLLKRLRKDLDEENPLLRALQPLMLRTLKQARYSTARKGHFALATLDYTHFTSPIRRYPDLMVHRLIKEGIGIRDGFDPSVDLEARCLHCSDAERTAMDAERKLIEIKKCRFMEPKLGEEFNAWISGVTEKGAFCQIDGHFVDGLINADTLYRWGGFQYMAQRMAYVTSGKKVLHLGHRLKVRLVAVDTQTRKIDFEPIEWIG